MRIQQLTAAMAIEAPVNWKHVQGAVSLSCLPVLIARFGSFELNLTTSRAG
jgi:hypothetical protein